MKKLITTILVFLLWSKAGFAGQTNYMLHVDGLVCPFCEYNVTKKLSKIDGVVEVKTNLKEGTVRVLVADGITLAESVVRQTITDAGFTLRSFEIYKSGTEQ